MTPTENLADRLNAMAIEFSVPGASDDIERCAKIVDMRAKVWEDAAKADVHGNCAMSLWEECEDIAQAIRKLKDTDQPTYAMARPTVTDNDKDEITVALNGKELRGWSYKDDAERRQKMVQAREYVEGWCDGREAMADRIKRRTDTRLNDYLCEMKPNYDDSITGFNEAWDIVRAILKEEIEREAPQPVLTSGEPK